MESSFLRIGGINFFDGYIHEPLHERNMITPVSYLRKKRGARLGNVINLVV